MASPERRAIFSFQTTVGRRFEHRAARKNRRLPASSGFNIAFARGGGSRGAEGENTKGITLSTLGDENKVERFVTDFQRAGKPLA
jgi:hypothetical protein